MNIKFPISAKQFAKIQERLTGQPASEDWCEIYRAIVPLLMIPTQWENERKSKKTFGIEAMVRKIAPPPERVNLIREFGLSLEAWCKLAYQTGGNEQK